MTPADRLTDEEERWLAERCYWERQSLVEPSGDSPGLRSVSRALAELRDLRAHMAQCDRFTDADREALHARLTNHSGDPTEKVGEHHSGEVTDMIGAPNHAPAPDATMPAEEPQQHQPE